MQCNQWTAFQNLLPTLFALQLHWRQIIRLHAANSRATQGFIRLQTFSHRDSTPQDLQRHLTL